MVVGFFLRVGVYYTLAATQVRNTAYAVKES